jgi:hypothetical protein
MKQSNILLVVAVLSIGAFSCCKKEADKPDIEQSLSFAGERTMGLQDSMVFALLGGVSIPANSPILLDTFATKVEETLAPFGVKKENIKSVTANSLSLQILNNPTQYLDFMDTVRIYIDSFNGNTPQLLASYNNIPLGLRSINLTTVSSDFKNYFKADFCKILLGGHVRAGYPILSNTQFKFNCGFKVVATP